MRFIINLFSVSENVEKKDVFIAVVPSDDESASAHADFDFPGVADSGNLTGFKDAEQFCRDLACRLTQNQT